MYTWEAEILSLNLAWATQQETSRATQQDSILKQKPFWKWIKQRARRSVRKLLSKHKDWSLILSSHDKARHWGTKRVPGAQWSAILDLSVSQSQGQILLPKSKMVSILSPQTKQGGQLQKTPKVSLLPPHTWHTHLHMCKQAHNTCVYMHTHRND